MGICWYCWWGWPKQTVEIYRDAIRKLGGFPDALEYGPSHVVWSDENFGDGTLDRCIRDCDERNYCERLSDSDLMIVRESLVRLRAIPEEIRDCEPADYDDEHPENFPPPAGIECIDPHTGAAR